MEALTLIDGKLAYTTAAATPEPSPDEVRVRVIQAGICETDLQLVRGYMGFTGILGHEFVGIAESGRFANQRVVGEINCSCLSCEFCRAGMSNHCPHRSVLGILRRNGAFAEYLVIPERNLHRVPDSVETEEAVFTEPLAAAFRIPEQIALDQSQSAIILGDGRLGNLCAQVLRPRVGRLIVVGKHDHKLERLRQMGIDTVRLDEADANRGADLVVDCTGRSSGLETALKLVRPLGTVVMKTTVAAEHRVPLAPIVIDEIKLLGSRCGPFAPALDALAKREIDVRPLVSKRFPLSRGLEAFDQAQRPDTLKVLLNPDSDR